MPPPPNPPPLPPRSSVAMQRASNTGDQLRLSNASLDSADGSGNNYKRMSNTADVRNGGSSPNVEPPLPPRNRVSQNLDLNLVIPIAPGGADMRLVQSNLDLVVRKPVFGVYDKAIFKTVSSVTETS